jgi:hypothetical protein
MGAAALHQSRETSLIGVSLASVPNSPSNSIEENSLRFILSISGISRTREWVYCLLSLMTEGSEVVLPPSAKTLFPSYAM